MCLWGFFAVEFWCQSDSRHEAYLLGIEEVFDAERQWTHTGAPEKVVVTGMYCRTCRSVKQQ